MAFPQVQSSTPTSITTAAAGNIAITYPSPINAGELLLCIIRRTGVGTHTYPTGWNELTEDSSDASDDVTSLAWRQADGTETGTFTVTISTGTEKFAALVYRVAGACDPQVSPPQISAVTVAATATPDPANLTPTGGAKDYLWFWIGGWEGEQTSPPTANPTNYSSNKAGADTGTTGAVTVNCRVAAITRENNAASENPGTWNIVTSDDTTCWTLAVHPPPPGGAEWAAPIFRPKKGYF